MSAESFPSALRGRQRDDALVSWLSASPLPVLAIGVALALVTAIVVIYVLMNPSLGEVVSLVETLSVTAIGSLGLGFVLYRRGWTRSPSLGLTLSLGYVWAAALTLFNVWIMARLMFASTHDLALSVVLLVFAAIIATTFGIFIAASVTQGLRQVAETARELSAGNLAARAPVTARDEVGQVARAINEMAEQLEQAASERDELEGMRRDLIAWVSHDLRTPLTSIRAMVEALNDGIVSDEETRRRYYQTIRQDVLFLNSLINDLFELAQLDAGLVLDTAPHSLSDLLSDALESFSVVAAARDVRLEGSVGDGLDPVPLNAAKIARVLSNLLGNAVKYTPAGGRVWLSARREAECVRVVVADTGPGFATADLPRIFEKFYRGESARTRASGGAGLGLSIAARIVEGHGGRIWAENDSGGGAIVGFELPAPAL